MAKNGVAIPSDENDAPIFDASNSSTTDNSSTTCVCVNSNGDYHEYILLSIYY